MCIPSACLENRNDTLSEEKGIDGLTVHGAASMSSPSGTTAPPHYREGGGEAMGELIRNAMNLPTYARTAPDMLSIEAEKHCRSCRLFRQAPLTRNCLAT